QNPESLINCATQEQLDQTPAELRPRGAKEPEERTPQEQATERQYREVVQDAIQAKLEELKKSGQLADTPEAKREVEQAVIQVIKLSLIADGLRQFLRGGNVNTRFFATLPGMLGSVTWLQQALASGKISKELVEKLESQIPSNLWERIEK